MGGDAPGSAGGGSDMQLVPASYNSRKPANVANSGVSVLESCYDQLDCSTEMGRLARDREFRRPTPPPLLSPIPLFRRLSSLHSPSPSNITFLAKTPTTQCTMSHETPVMYAPQPPRSYISTLRVSSKPHPGGRSHPRDPVAPSARVVPSRDMSI
ncbi:hypothetical protein EVAR_68143_1 [Eumeta japonica]|uniref:Uncharacterized protein n=1 Tax=Eumeta variegata TaxID=151549 RepID=A0A4C2A450_EUMVA|nr:hypothetical protein EVAR_68143_1 [Eumeta japonica]